MRYVAAYLLAVLGGSKSPKKDDISKILSSVGIEVEDAKLEKVVAELTGKSIEELITNGKFQLPLAPCPLKLIVFFIIRS